MKKSEIIATLWYNNSMEVDYMDKKRKFFWILIGIGCVCVFFLFLVSSVLDVGIKLRTINPFVEYGFYLLVFLLVFFLIINPIRIIVFSPTFSIETVLDKPSRKNRRTTRKMAKTVMKNPAIDMVDVEKIKNSINKDEELRKEMNRILNGPLKKELNKIILRNAKTVLVSTAISQNGKLDMFTVVTVNLKMIKELVVTCGFRPSGAKLGKLSLRVLGTALIAEGLENIDLENILPASSTNFLAEIPLIKPVMSSIVQGISNALLTIRVGVVTRKYLFADAGAYTKSEIRIQALKESLKLLPIVVKDSLAMFPKSISKLFKKDKAEEAA